MKANIEGYGIYIPRYRIKYEEFRSAWDNVQYLLNTGPRLNVLEKVCPHYDEDSITMAVEAGKNAIKSARTPEGAIDALVLGTASPPYKNRDSCSTVAMALGLKDNIISLEVNQSSRSGTSALIVALGLVESGISERALVIASDTTKPEPGSELEPTLAAGAGALIISRKDGIAEIEAHSSFVSETFDLWNRADKEMLKYDDTVYRTHFLKAIKNSGSNLLAKVGLKATDYNYVCFQQPNGKREPIGAGKVLGFDKAQIEPAIVASHVGDAHSASVFLSLAKVLDTAKDSERIFLSSYGSGGSDSFSIKTRPGIANLQRPALVREYIDDKIYINYITYLKFLRLIIQLPIQEEPFPSTWEIMRLNPYRYRPLLYECAECGFQLTSLQKVCPSCHAQTWKEPVGLPDKGFIYSFTEGTVAPGPNWDEEVREKYSVAMIEFPNGKRVTSKFVETENSELRIGTEAEVCFRKYLTSPVNLYAYKFRPPLKRG